MLSIEFLQGLTDEQRLYLKELCDKGHENGEQYSFEELAEKIQMKFQSGTIEGLAIKIRLLLVPLGSCSHDETYSED